MLSLLYKAFSAILVVSVVFFGNNFRISLECLYNFCTRRFQGFLYSSFFCE